MKILYKGKKHKVYGVRYVDYEETCRACAAFLIFDKWWQWVWDSECELYKKKKHKKKGSKNKNEKICM